MIICWNHGQASAIHDHAGAHCVMKVLDGELVEELYSMPEDVDSLVGNSSEPGAMKPRQITTICTNKTVYISDQIGLHRIANESHVLQAVSLHLYCPPYSTCNTFCERTGAARVSGKMTFYSKGGVVCPPLER